MLGSMRILVISAFVVGFSSLLALDIEAQRFAQDAAHVRLVGVRDQGGEIKIGTDQRKAACRYPEHFRQLSGGIAEAAGPADEESKRQPLRFQRSDPASVVLASRCVQNPEKRRTR